MIIDDELFVGYDDFQYLELYLQGADPLDPSELDAWSQAQITPSATRGSR